MLKFCSPVQDCHSQFDRMGLDKCLPVVWQATEIDKLSININGKTQAKRSSLSLRI